MPQGKSICEDVQWIIICLSAELSSEDIFMYTNISECKDKAILACQRGLGELVSLNAWDPTCIESFKMRTLGYVSGYFLYLFCYCKFHFTASLENNK